MFHQTSHDLLEVLLLSRVLVLLAELDGREESGVVVIVLEKKQLNEQNYITPSLTLLMPDQNKDSNWVGGILSKPLVGGFFKCFFMT